MIFRRHFSPDDAGGGGSASKAAEQDGGSNAGNVGGTGGAGNSAATGDGSGKPTLEDQIKTLTSANTTLQTKHDELTTSYGKQTDQIGRLKKIGSALTDKNPDVRKSLIQGFAKQAGLDVSFDKPNAGATSDGNDGDGDNKGEAGFDQIAFEKAMNQQIRSIMDPVQEQMLATKHTDWDAMTDHRNALAIDLSTSKVGQDELLHYAARGRNLADILDGHKDMVIKEYQEGLARKNEGQISGTGDAGGKTSTKKAVESIDEAIEAGILPA